MKHTILTILLLVVCTLAVQAEVVTLKTGAKVYGTVVFQNEEVVILKDASGARYQYPRADVESVSEDAKTSEAATPTEAIKQQTGQKKVMLGLELAGGVATWPTDTTGGYMAVNLLIGSRRIGTRRMLIGGGVGYLGEYLGGEKYNFMPLQVALRMPIIEGKHAPLFGAGIGYAVGLSKDYKGGIYAGFDLGYLYTSNKGSSIYVGADLHFLQASVNRPQVITAEESSTIYTGRVGRNFLNAGLKLGFFF